MRVKLRARVFPPYTSKAAPSGTKQILGPAREGGVNYRFREVWLQTPSARPAPCQKAPMLKLEGALSPPILASEMYPRGKWSSEREGSLLRSHSLCLQLPDTRLPHLHLGPSLLSCLLSRSGQSPPSHCVSWQPLPGSNQHCHSLFPLPRTPSPPSSGPSKLLFILQGPVPISPSPAPKTTVTPRLRKTNKRMLKP